MVARKTCLKNGYDKEKAKKLALEMERNQFNNHHTNDEEDWWSYSELMFLLRKDNSI